MVMMSLLEKPPNLLKIIPSLMMTSDADVSAIVTPSPISSDSDGVAISVVIWFIYGIITV